MLILTAKEIEKYNFENNVSRHCKVFKNSGNSIFSSTNEDVEIITVPGNKKNRHVRHIVTSNSAKYAGSGEEARRLQKINDCIRLIKKKFSSPNQMKANISHMPEDAKDFFDLIRLDITRRTLARQDIVPFICNVVANANFTNPTNPQWLYEYVAPFEKFEGKGDNINLVQIATGDKDAIYFTIWGVGFWQDLYNMLFNQIFDMGRVNDAVARGYTANKNDLIISQILDFAYPTEKQVAAATGDSLEDSYYITLNDAIEKLGTLKDPQTNREINILDGITLLCHSTKVRTIRRAINGRLQNGDDVRNLEPLTEINQIIPYNGDKLIYGEEEKDYRGIPTTKAYMFIPRSGFWYLEKRGLTMQTGPGDVFAFTSNKDAWYYCDASYSDQFFGGDTGGTTEEKEQGYIVEITLPT